MAHIRTAASPEAAKVIIEQQAGGLVLDVREEEEFITGHLENAILFPLDTINRETAGALIPGMDTPLLVYCRSGSRSRQAAYILEALGYTNIWNLGGLAGWPYELSW